MFYLSVIGASITFGSKIQHTQHCWISCFTITFLWRWRALFRSGGRWRHWCWRFWRWGFLFRLSGIAIVMIGTIFFPFLLEEGSSAAAALPPMPAYSSRIASLNMGTPHNEHDYDHECEVFEAKTTHFSAEEGGGGGGGRCCGFQR